MVEVKVSRRLRKKPKVKVPFEAYEWYRAQEAGAGGVFIVYTTPDRVLYFGTDRIYGEGTQMGQDDKSVIECGTVVLLEKISDRIKVTIELND